jgi:nicotinamidase/pyrazinamidase
VKTVFFDVDTQLDFLYPAGALFVPGAQHLIDSLSALTRYAAANSIQIISTADAHLEDDPEFRVWKPHCVAGTVGQTKAAATSLSPSLVVSTATDALKSISTAALASAPQIVVEKQQLDPFTNPNLAPLLDLLKAGRFVVYGVVTEYCVVSAALGLLKTGAQVELVQDAVKSLSETDERDLISRFEAQGGKLTSVRDVLAGSGR